MSTSMARCSVSFDVVDELREARPVVQRAGIVRCKQHLAETGGLADLLNRSPIRQQIVGGTDIGEDVGAFFHQRQGLTEPYARLVGAVGGEMGQNNGDIGVFQGHGLPE